MQYKLDPHCVMPLNSAHLSADKKRRAQSLINDNSIARTVLRYGLELDDPSLAELARRIDAANVIKQ